MDEDEARSRFAAARVGRLATVRAQAEPHVVPVVFAIVHDPLNGDVVYTAVDAKPKTTLRLQRLANIEATGRASLLVDEYREDWRGLWWVRFDASAEVLALDSDKARVAVEALMAKYPQYVKDPPPGPVISLRLTRWRWWAATP